MDIWIAPNDQNKQAFLNTLLCIGYLEEELKTLKTQDFTRHLLCTLGEPPHVIDVLTIVHQNISFDKAENSTVVHQLDASLNVRMVSYEVLKDMKTRSSRSKDHYDIDQLEKLRKGR